MVGTGAVIATARHIPVAMMLTAEIDIYAEEATDPALVSDLIDGSIGRYSQFHRTFGVLYGGGVGGHPGEVCRGDSRERRRGIIPSAIEIDSPVEPSPSWRAQARHPRVC